MISMTEPDTFGTSVSIETPGKEARLIAEELLGTFVDRHDETLRIGGHGSIGEQSHDRAEERLEWHERQRWPPNPAPTTCCQLLRSRSKLTSSQGASIRHFPARTPSGGLAGHPTWDTKAIVPAEVFSKRLPCDCRHVLLHPIEGRYRGLGRRFR